MTKDEALDLALEALETVRHKIDSYQVNVCDDVDATITAIKQALAAPMEPVAFFDWYDNAHWGNEDFKEGCHRSWNAAIKYTTPPAAQRQWVGLTDREKSNLWLGSRAAIPRYHTYATLVEAKLKELNT